MEIDDKEEVRTRVDIVELISSYTALKPAAGRFKGLCPFHQEKTPSFTVDPGRGTWHCFGACQDGGDVFRFVMKADGLTFREALERLAARVGYTLTGRGDPDSARRTQSERERLFDANAFALRFFQQTFQRAEVARRYAQERGLVHETLTAFAIGFAPDDWSALGDWLPRQGVALEDAEKAGLLSPSRRGDGGFIDRFRGRLIFPIFDLQERVAAFGGRLLFPSDTAPKYLNSPETPLFSKSRILYGLGLPHRKGAREAIQKEDRAVMVEGYMDVVAAHQAGIRNVVAPLGTALTEHHIALLGRFTKNIVLSFDADEAGIRAALRSAALFAAAGPFFSLRVLALPPGEDPDSMMRRGDVTGFRRAIDQAVTVPEFRLNALERTLDLHDESGRQEFLRQALPILADSTSPLEQDRLIRRLAPFHPAFQSGGSHAEVSLRSELRRFGGVAPDDLPPPAPKAPWTGPRRSGGDSSPPGRRRPFRHEPPPPAPPPESQRPTFGRAARNAERTILRALLRDDWAKIVQQRAPGTGLIPLFAAGSGDELPLLNVLLLGFRRGATPTVILREDLSEGPLRDQADRIEFESDEDNLSEEAIADCLALLEKRRLQAANREIQAARAEGNHPDDNELLRRWAENARAKQRGADPLPEG